MRAHSPRRSRLSLLYYASIGILPHGVGCQLSARYLRTRVVAAARKLRQIHKTGASSPLRGPFFLHGPPTRGSLSARKSAIIEAEEWRGDLRSMGIAPDHREGR